MTRFLAWRLVVVLPTLFGVLVVAFLLLHVAPGDPVQAMVGERADSATMVRLRAELHIDEPLPKRFGLYTAGVLRGDFGNSYITGRPILGELLHRFPNDRAHFMAICGSAMRQLIIGYARQKLTEKRGSNPLMMDVNALDIPTQGEAEELILIDQALKSLARADERMVRVFECRFFAGYTEEETADALEISLRTVQRDWMRARAWVKELLDST